MPICRRLDDGRVEVEIPTPPTVDRTPFAPHLIASATVGPATWFVAGKEDSHVGYGGMLEIERCDTCDNVDRLRGAC